MLALIFQGLLAFVCVLDCKTQDSNFKQLMNGWVHDLNEIF